MPVEEVKDQTRHGCAITSMEFMKDVNNDRGEMVGRERDIEYLAVTHKTQDAEHT